MTKQMDSFYSYIYSKNPKKKDVVEVSLDSNMVGYLYALSKSGGLSAMEYIELNKNRDNSLTAEQYDIIFNIIENNFNGFKFYTTPQVEHEVRRCAEIQGNYGIVRFLENLCKIKIAKSATDKFKHAEIISDLMDEYLKEDILLSNDVREPQSAIISEMKNGVKNFADAKVVSENTVLNGKPLVTRNEKHLIAMRQFKRRNKLRSDAIREKNKKYLIANRNNIKDGQVRVNLANEKSTTFRINEIPDLIEGR